MKKLFIITGEFSADVHAAGVVKKLKEKMPSILPYFSYFTYFLPVIEFMMAISLTLPSEIGFP